MKKYVTLALFSLMSLSFLAQDTFSIIAVDPLTGEVGSAGASCVAGAPVNWDTWITDIIPGKGGVNSQAYICIPNSNLANAINRMELGDSPQQIIDWLVLNDACNSQNFDPEYRQYGIVDLDESNNPRAAGWTGSSADDYKEDRQGPNYSIQGNILLNVGVIDNMEANFDNTSGTLAEKLMAALQGAKVPGADSRCLADGTSSRAAYMVVYKPDDNPGEPYLRLVVSTQSNGVEPIDVLQDLYDNFLTVSENPLANKVFLFPNPASDFLELRLDDSITQGTYAISDTSGKQLVLESINSNTMRIDVPTLSRGLYFVTITTVAGTITFKFVKK